MGTRSLLDISAQTYRPGPVVSISTGLSPWHSIGQRFGTPPSSLVSLLLPGDPRSPQQDPSVWPSPYLRLHGDSGIGRVAQGSTNRADRHLACHFGRGAACPVLLSFSFSFSQGFRYSRGTYLDGLGENVFVDLQLRGARLSCANSLATPESAQGSFIDLHPICGTVQPSHLQPRESYQNDQNKVKSYLLDQGLGGGKRASLESPACRTRSTSSLSP